ncbi:Nn.00g036140.m01.CDS01 [Neocucurbitaria sp. VM-36]
MSSPPPTTTQRPHWTTHITHILDSALARKTRREEEESTTTAAIRAIQRFNLTTEQEAHELAALTNQQPRPSYLNGSKDELYPDVARYLRNTFTELRHELRDERETWKAWHSVANRSSCENVGRRMIREVDGCAVGTVLVKRKQAVQKGTEVLDGCALQDCNASDSGEGVQGRGHEAATSTTNGATQEYCGTPWWAAYPSLVQILGMPDPQAFVNDMPCHTPIAIECWAMAVQMLKEVREGQWVEWRESRGLIGSEGMQSVLLRWDQVS